MSRGLRLLGVVSLLLFAWASVADARGGMGVGGGGGRKRGSSKGGRAAAQGEKLIHDAFRRDVITRARYAGW